MKTSYCRYCGNSKADHSQTWSRCYGYVAKDKPTCRVCGSGFDPAKSGREDCCSRHRNDS
jgi:hypothetical protein